MEFQARFVQVQASLMYSPYPEASYISSSFEILYTHHLLALIYFVHGRMIQNPAFERNRRSFSSYKGNTQ